MKSTTFIWFRGKNTKWTLNHTWATIYLILGCLTRTGLIMSFREILEYYPYLINLQARPIHFFLWYDLGWRVQRKKGEWSRHQQKRTHSFSVKIIKNSNTEREVVDGATNNWYKDAVEIIRGHKWNIFYYGFSSLLLELCLLCRVSFTNTLYCAYIGGPVVCPRM